MKYVSANKAGVRSSQLSQSQCSGLALLFVISRLRIKLRVVLAVVFSAWALCFSPAVFAGMITQSFTGGLDNIVTNKNIKVSSTLPKVELIAQKTLVHTSKAAAKTINKFDASLGSLNSVIIDYEIIGGRPNRNGFEMLSQSCQDAYILGECKTYSYVDYRAFYGVILSNWDPGRPGGVPDNNVYFTPVEIGLGRVFQGDNNESFFNSLIGESISKTITTDLHAFIGAETFNVVSAIDTYNDTSIDCYLSIIPYITSCEGSSRAYYSADYRVTVNYDYTPFTIEPGTQVPTPSTLPLSLMAFSVLGLAIRMKGLSNNDNRDDH